MLGPVVEVLRHPVGGTHVGEVLGGAEGVSDALEQPRDRIALGRRVVGLQGVGLQRRLEGLVVHRQGTLRHTRGSEEPGHAFWVHDEGHDQLIRLGVHAHVRHVVAAPLVPQPLDDDTVGVPGLASQVAGGAVVDDAAVGRPGITPVEGLAQTARVAGIAAGRQVAGLGPHAAVNPVARGGAAVVAQVGEGAQLLATLGQDLGGVLGIEHIPQGLARDLLRQLLRVRASGDDIGPGQTLDGIREGTAFAGVERLQPGKQARHDLDIALGLAGSVRRLPVPLDDAPRVGEAAVVLGEEGRGQAEDLGLDLGRVHVVEFAVILPELGSFGGQGIHDDQVLELGQPFRHPGLVRHRRQGVEALAEEAVHLAPVHLLEHGQDVIGLVLLRQPVIAEVVVRRGRHAIEGLAQAGEPLGEVLRKVHLPRAQGLGGTLVEVGRPILVGIRGRAQIARQNLGVEALVGDALDVGVSAQGVDATPGHAHVTQQELDHGHGADVLRPHAVLGPAQGVADGHGPVGGRGLGDQLADLEEVLLGGATDLAHHGRRVGRIVALHDLEDAVGAIEGLIDLGEAFLILQVLPGGFVVLALGGVITREEPILKAEVLIDEEAGIGVGLDVIVMDLVVAQQVVDDPAQEGDVAAGADRGVEVGNGGRAVVTRVHHHEFGLATGLSLDHPLETAGVGLGRIAAHDQDQIGVLDINPMVGHRTTPERRSQTGHRGGVSNARLGIEGNDAESAQNLMGEIARLVVDRGTGQEAGGVPAVDGDALAVGGLEVGVPVGLHMLGDTGEGLVPGDNLPLLGAGLAHFGHQEAVLAVDHVH